MADEWTPRPAEPYEPGNLAAAKHGTYSERLLKTDTTEIIERAVEIVPWLDRPEFRSALRSWARAEAVAERAFAALIEDGKLNVGRRSNIFERWRSAENLARALRGDLGLDPSSRMKLGADFAHAQRDALLAEQLEEGRRIRLEAERRHALSAEGDGEPRDTQDTTGDDPESEEDDNGA